MTLEKKKKIYIAIGIVVVGLIVFAYMTGRDERSILGRWYVVDSSGNVNEREEYFEFYDDGSMGIGANNRDNVHYADWQIKNHQLWIRDAEDMNPDIIKMHYSIENKYLTLWSAEEELIDDTEKMKLIRSTEVTEAW
nr:hypothetical protein [uncultured Anaerostipes sp.]